MTSLWAVTVRTAFLIRCIAIAYIAAQVLIWHSFYAAAHGAWRGLPPRWRGASWCWPACGTAAPGGSFRAWIPAFWWLLRSPQDCACRPPCAAIPPTGCTSCWRASSSSRRGSRPSRLLAPLAVTSAAAYWAGAVLTPQAGSPSSSPAAASALLLAVAAAAWAAPADSLPLGDRADAALARADLDSASITSCCQGTSNAASMSACCMTRCSILSPP